MKRQCSVTIVVNDQKQVLALRRGMDTETFPGKWNFPGGGVEDDESIGEAAVRELQEEAGLVTNPSDLLYMNTHNHSALVIHFFITNKYEGEVNINFESTEYKWLTLPELITIDFIPMDLEFISEIKYYMEILDATN